MSEKLNLGKTWKFSITYEMNFISFITKIISGKLIAIENRLKINLKLGYCSLLTHENFDEIRNQNSLIFAKKIGFQSQQASTRLSIGND